MTNRERMERKGGERRRERRGERKKREYKKIKNINFIPSRLATATSSI